MKRIILFILLLGTFKPAKAQLRQMFQQSYFLPGMAVMMNADFMEDEDNVFIKYPQEKTNHEYYAVFGNDLDIRAVIRDSTVSWSELNAGAIVMDTIPEHQIPMTALEVRVIKNGLVYRNWCTITSLPSYAEKFMVYKDRRPKEVPGYRIFKDKILAGDTIQVQCRQKDQIPFIFFYYIKKPDKKQPFILSYTVGNKLVSTYNSTQVKDDFYKNWPGPGGLLAGGSGTIVDNVLTLHFRPESDSTGYPIKSEYKLIRNNIDTFAWKEFSGDLKLENLAPNSFYRLDVNYVGKDIPISSYYFSTRPRWYQSPLLPVTISLLLLAATLYLLLKNARRKHRMKSLEMQAIRAQMNPHFLFNALSSIQGLMNNNQIDEANKYFADFSRLLRSTISSSRNELVPLSEELRNLKNYIDLERLRFGFRYIFEVDPKINVNNLEIPPLLAQPLIENAIKHGLGGKREAALLHINFQQDGKDLRIAITDNGHGFNVGQTNDGHGIQLTRNRIALFNRMYKPLKIQLEIQSDNNGTRCLLLLKNWIDK